MPGTRDCSGKPPSVALQNVQETETDTDRQGRWSEFGLSEDSSHFDSTDDWSILGSVAAQAKFRKYAKLALAHGADVARVIPAHRVETAWLR